MGRKLGFAWVALALIFALPFGGAAAQTVPQGSIPPLAGAAPLAAASKLSPRLQTLADAPQLWHSDGRALAGALHLPAQGAGTLMQDAQDRVLVEIRVADTSAAVLDALAASGAQIVHVAPEYATVTAQVAPDILNGLAGLGAVANVTEDLAPVRAGEKWGGRMPEGTAAGLSAPASTCPVGDFVSGGNTQLKASQARTTFGVNGAGVKVGILSDSFDADTSAPTDASQDVTSGDLPGATNTCGFTTPVHVISDTAPSSSVIDEGRAMAQIVHDLAPGAQLGFATADFGLFQFGDNIRALRTWGARVIADDIFYFVEPMFQESPVGVAVSNVTATGAVYFTAAGNDNVTVGGHEIASYEAPSYRSSPVPAYMPFGNFGLESCHDFNPGAGVDPTYNITIGSGGGTFVDVQWAEPWYGVTTDLDVIVSDATDTTVIDYSHYHNAGGTGTQTPFEIVGWDNTSGSAKTYHIHVCRTTQFGGDAASPRFKMVLVEPFRVTGVEYPVSSGGDIVGPAIFGHSASQYALSVAAVPENENTTPEDFSSAGPATHYFGPIVDNHPAAAITPVVLPQPDFTATDGNCTTFFIDFSAGCYRFFGTSAAAPHAAAVAALMVQTSNLTPTLPINQGTVKLLLKATAASMSGGTVNDVGSGLIQALGAITKQLTFVKHLFLPLIRR